MTVARPAADLARGGVAGARRRRRAGGLHGGRNRGVVAGDALTATGLPNPGPATTLGLPFVRAAGEIAAVLAVGAFLFAAFLAPPQSTGVLDVGGYRALRLGTVASGVWAVCAALLVPLTISDVSGHPLADHLNPVTTVVAGRPGQHRVRLALDRGAWPRLVTLASLSVLRWSWTPLLLVGSLVTLVPLGLTGHSSAGGSHDLATNSLLIHLVAASLWAGGLLALLAHALRGGEHAGPGGTALLRDRIVVLGRDGAQRRRQRPGADAAVRPADHRLRTAGGRQVRRAVHAGRPRLAPAAHRSRCAASRSGLVQARGALIRLALIEAAVFGLTFGIAVGLGRTPPPPPPIRLPSIPEAEIGYDFAGPPTLARILFDWRFDLDLRHGGDRFGRAVRGRRWCGCAAAATAGRRAGPSAWLLGCAALLFVTSSGVGRYMPAMFSMHMAAHMGLSMLVPILLVLGAPVSLALRALPAAGRDDPPGMREWLLAALHSRLLAVPHQPGGRHRAVRRGLLRAVLRRASSTPRWAVTPAIWR